MRALNDTALEKLLTDDVPGGDLTTESLGIGAQSGRLLFLARQAMTVCATEEAVRLFELAGARAFVKVGSGTTAVHDTVLLEAEGTAADLHRAWKVAQTLMEWASGIATATAEIVAAANGVAVACTRKNVPGAKAMSIKAVRSGGGILHRLGLSESLLIFPEHRLYLDESPAQTVERLRRTQPEKKIVVEVAHVDDALLWAVAGVDVLQLEKFTPDSVAACGRAVNGCTRRPMLAAAGGVRADNAALYVAAGAELLVTSAPYTAPPRDVQVTFIKSP